MAAQRYPTGKNILNNKTPQLEREIQQLKGKSTIRYLHELTTASEAEYSLWKAAKRLKRPIIQIPSIRTTKGNWAKYNKQKADTFELKETEANKRSS